MSELSPRSETTPRPDYSFEQLEAAVEMAPLVDIDDISSDFAFVGRMMLDRVSEYRIFVNQTGVFIKALVSRY